MGKLKVVAGNLAADVGDKLGVAEGIPDKNEAHFTSKKGSAKCDQKDWMGKLPDNKKIGEMFIPGTHDTMADNGGTMVQCQCWSVKEQLESGIRFLDIRVKHIDDTFPCYHGPAALGTNLSDAIAACETFIAEHPKEAIFARIKSEGEEGKHTCPFAVGFQKLLKNTAVWNFGEQRFDQLSRLRGKITLINYQFPNEDNLLWEQMLDIQDEFESAVEDKKFAEIKKHSTKAKTDGAISINFCSAVGLDGLCVKSPGGLAYEVNKFCHDKSAELNACVLVMDFPGNEMIKKMIERNN